MLKGNRGTEISQNNQKRPEENVKRGTFEFLVPEIPAIKSELNVIPTGKQIPRTPLKSEIKESSPKSNTDLEFCGVQIEDEESIFKNMIPNGREIPRTPPNYTNLPFLMSGCVAKPLIQNSDLGVKPIGDIDVLDKTIIKIKVEENNITVRKRPLPKTNNIDIVLAQMMDEIKVEGDENSIKVDKKHQECKEVSRPVLKDVVVKQTKPCQALAKGRKKQSNKEEQSSSSNVQTRRNPSRRAREGINYCI